MMAETEGFEPSVGEYPLRRFSKPLVSATHPRLRVRPLAGRAGYISAIAKLQPEQFSRPTANPFLHPGLRTIHSLETSLGIKLQYSLREDSRGKY